jgi:hypothetical protein
MFIAPLVVLGFLGIGWLVTRDSKSVETLRRIYRWTMYPLSGLLSGVIILFVQSSHGLKVVSLARAIYPEFRIASTVMELVPFGLLLATLVGELLFLPRSEVNPVAETWVVRSYRMRFAWAGLMMGALLASPFKGPNALPMLMIFAIQVALPSPFLPGTDSRPLDSSEWAQEIANAARHFGTVIPMVRVVDGDGAPVLSTRSSTIVVGAKLASELTGSELRFLVAREIIYLRDCPKVAFAESPLAFLVLTSGVFAMSVAVQSEFSVAFRLSLAVCLIALCGCGLWRLRRLGQERHVTSLRVDAEALTYSKDLGSARSALEKINVDTSRSGITRLTDRLARLQVQAGSLRY